MAEKMQHQTIEIKRSDVSEDGTIEGYASVFDVIDKGMDVVSKGAFAGSVARHAQEPIKMLWQHDTEQPIGVWDEIREDDRGLYVKGRLFVNVQRGKEALELLRGGAINQMSIGYLVIKALDEGGGRVRRLAEVDLKEVSIVTFPMLPDAKVTGVKSIATPKEFVEALQALGYSQKEAEAIEAGGYSELEAVQNSGAEGVIEDDEDAEQGEDLAEYAKLLTELAEALNNG